LPNLERITIVGFSAGAQIVNRWALFSPMEPQLIQNDAKMLQGQHPNADATGTTVAQDSAAQSAKASVTVRAIVADGSSYVYLDQRRPDPKACNQGKDTGSNHTCTAFAVPGSSSVEACPMYNDFKYGLANLSYRAEKSLYIAPFATDAARLSAAATAFASVKDVRYVFGTQDVCNCNVPLFINADACYIPHATCSPDSYGGPHCCDTYPDTRTENAVAHTCSAMLEGTNRLQRGLNYIGYLAAYSNNTVSPKHGFFDGGHNNTAFYASSIFKAWAYT